MTDAARSSERTRTTGSARSRSFFVRAVEREARFETTARAATFEAAQPAPRTRTRFGHRTVHVACARTPFFGARERRRRPEFAFACSGPGMRGGIAVLALCRASDGVAPRTTSRTECGVSARSPRTPWRQRPVRSCVERGMRDRGDSIRVRAAAARSTSRRDIPRDASPSHARMQRRATAAVLSTSPSVHRHLGAFPSAEAERGAASTQATHAAATRRVRWLAGARSERSPRTHRGEHDRLLDHTAVPHRPSTRRARAEHATTVTHPSGATSDLAWRPTRRSRAPAPRVRCVIP